MKKIKSFLVAVWLSFGILFSPVLVREASAYIGPGAGIAFFSSFFIFLATFLIAILIILFWPIRVLTQAIKRRFKYRRYFDGDDLVKRLASEMYISRAALRWRLRKLGLSAPLSAVWN